MTDGSARNAAIAEQVADRAEADLAQDVRQRLVRADQRVAHIAGMAHWRASSSEPAGKGMPFGPMIGWPPIVPTAPAATRM